MLAIRRPRAALALAALPVLAALAAAPPAAAASPETAQTRRICEASAGDVPPARIAALKRGFSLPGWTDEFPVRPPSLKLMAEIRRSGLTHVRLPVRPEHIHPRFADKATAERTLKNLDGVLDALERLDFAASVDLHPGGAFNTLHRTDPAAALKVLTEAWTTLAERYRSRSPDRVFFELLNEPEPPPAVWNPQAAALARHVRALAPQHTLIVSPANFQRHEALEALEALPDGNIAYAFHYYDPMPFTHQGATWSSDPISKLGGIPYPARPQDLEAFAARLEKDGHPDAAKEFRGVFREPWTDARIDAVFSRVADWAVRNRRPVIVNEFGVLSFAAPPVARAAWIRAVRRAAEKHCIGWTHWEYADGFGFVKRDKDGRERFDPVVGPELLEPL